MSSPWAEGTSEQCCTWLGAQSSRMSWQRRGAQTARFRLVAVERCTNSCLGRSESSDLIPRHQWFSRRSMPREPWLVYQLLASTNLPFLSLWYYTRLIWKRTRCGARSRNQTLKLAPATRWSDRPDRNGLASKTNTAVVWRIQDPSVLALLNRGWFGMLLGYQLRHPDTSIAGSRKESGPCLFNWCCYRHRGTSIL
jgi:hypothetical protein